MGCIQSNWISRLKFQRGKWLVGLITERDSRLDLNVKLIPTHHSQILIRERSYSTQLAYMTLTTTLLWSIVIKSSRVWKFFCFGLGKFSWLSNFYRFYPQSAIFGNFRGRYRAFLGLNVCSWAWTMVPIMLMTFSMMVMMIWRTISQTALDRVLDELERSPKQVNHLNTMSKIQHSSGPAVNV